MSLDEQVDVVNESNKVIGNTSKHHAHEAGLLHRTVIAEVIDTDGNWTLVKQASDRQDAGQFVSPIGGHVKAGETEVEALKREAAEEYGLTEAFSYKLVGSQIFNREINGKKENHYFILYEIKTNKMPILNEESVAFQRFSKAELKRQIKTNPSNFGAAFHFVVKTFYPDLLTPIF